MLIQPGKLTPVSLPAQQNKQQRPGEVSEGFSSAPVDSCQVVSLPPLEEHSEADCKRGYLWQAVPLPGPIDGILGAVVSFGPMPRWLGLEPAPRGKPEVHPLDFSWTGVSSEEFARKMAVFEARLRDPQAVETGKQRIRAGSNGNYLVSLSTDVAAVWTPTATESRAGEFRPHLEEKRMAQREEAAYVVDRFLGHLARVPPCVASGLEGRAGALKLFVPCGPCAERGTEVGEEDYRRIAIFDHVIGNLDRHHGNWLVDETGRPVPIDHGLAFPLANGDQGHTNFNFDRTFELNDEEQARLAGFLERRDEVARELSPLLNPRAVAAMFERVEAMLATGRVSHAWRTGVS